MSWGQWGGAGPHVFGRHVVDGAATAAAARALSTTPLLPAGLHLLVDVWAEVEQTLLCWKGQERGERGWMEEEIEMMRIGGEKKRNQRRIT